MEQKSTNSVSIIGGADGPTSIFLAGNCRKQSFKNRVRTYFYKKKRKRIERKITAGDHTLEELVSYAIEKYHAVEMSPQSISYLEQKGSLKERLVIESKPELLDDFQLIDRPDFSNEVAVKEYLQQLKLRSKYITDILDSEIGMDFHVLKILVADGSLELAVDYAWNILGVSYSGDGKAMKQLNKISKDLYLYYGVTEEYIKEKTNRYSELVVALSS